MCFGRASAVWFIEASGSPEQYEVRHGGDEIMCLLKTLLS